MELHASASSRTTPSTVKTLQGREPRALGSLSLGINNLFPLSLLEIPRHLRAHQTFARYSRWRGCSTEASSKRGRAPLSARNATYSCFGPWLREVDSSQHDGHDLGATLVMSLQVFWCFQRIVPVQKVSRKMLEKVIPTHPERNDVERALRNSLFFRIERRTAMWSLGDMLVA